MIRHLNYSTVPIEIKKVQRRKAYQTKVSEALLGLKTISDIVWLPNKPFPLHTRPSNLLLESFLSMHFVSIRSLWHDI